MKKIILRYWPVLVLGFVWIIFASPYLFGGRVPFPSAYLVDFFPPWNASFGLPVKNNAMPDIITQIYPWKQITIDAWREGTIPGWNPYQFAGNPHLANVQSAAFTPLNLLYFVIPFLDAWSIHILLQPLLAAFGMYAFLRHVVRTQYAALLGGIAFMFSGFLVVWMAYGTLGYAILFLPYMLLGIRRWFSSPTLLHVFIVTLPVPLSFFSGHVQTSTYFLGFGLMYLLWETIRTRHYRRGLTALMLVGLGIILSLPQLLPSISFYEQSIRSELFQKAEVIPWNYVPTLFAPDLFGNAVTRNDWFGHYAEWASYIGVAPLMLAFLSWLHTRRREVLFFSIMAIGTLLLAYPTILGDLVLALRIPVLSTSSFSRIIVLTSFSLSVLAAFGIDALHHRWKDIGSRKRVLTVLALFAGGVFIMWAMILRGNLMFIPDVTPEHLHIAKRNLILPTALMVAATLALIAGFVRRRYVRRVALGVLIAVTIFDMLRFSTKWMPFDPREYVYPEVGVLTYLEENAGAWRVFGNLGNEALAPFGLLGIEGYDPLYIRRYGELIMATGDGTRHEPARSTVTIGRNGAFTKTMFDLLGVRYIVHSKGDGRNVWAFPFWEYPDDIGSAIYSDDTYEVYENTGVIPRAFTTRSYIVADDADVISVMLDQVTDLSQTVVLTAPPSFAAPQTVSEEIDGREATIIEYLPNKVTIEARVSHPSLLFLSDNYYHGWVAYVNGERAQILQADYTFRAVEIPSGASVVEFVYEDWYL